jgi:proteasome lid subunit RPN8/RPN11
VKPLRPRLPVRPLCGSFLIAEAALRATERLLATYRGPDGDHEGLVFLCGRELGSTTLLTTAIAPDCEHEIGRVMCSLAEVQRVTERSHEAGLGVLAQVHSHPGAFSEHSRGDDHMVLMPFEGMLSVVVPHYARYGMRPLQNMGVHQHRDGRWVRVEPASVRTGIMLLPAALDLR